MKSNKLLVITNGFPDVRNNRYHCQFVYEMTKLIADQFSEIKVISPQPYFPQMLRIFPIFAGLAKVSGFKNYSMLNMSIYYPNFFTLPLEYLRKLNFLKMAATIKNTLIKTRFIPDIVHVHFLSPSGLAALEVLPADKPKILSLPGGDLYEWAVSNPTEAARAMSQFSLIQVPTVEMGQLVTKIDKELADRVRIIPPSVDLELFRPGEAKPSRYNLLMVANLIPEKGILDSLEIVCRLKQNYVDIHLDIIGTGPLEWSLRREIVLMGLNKAVRLVGPVKHADLPKWYRQANLLLFPSYEESFGIVQIEAMACGTSVVAYDNLGSLSIFADRPEWLVKKGNITELVSKVKEILDSPPSEKVLTQIAGRYSVPKIQNKLASLYKEALNN